MKIAMLTSFFLPHRGGTEKYVLDLSLALLKNGHEVTVFTHTRGIQMNYKGVKIVRIPSVWIPYQPILAKKLKKEMEGFDIIHAHVPPYFFNETTVIPDSVPLITTYHCDVLIPEKYKGIVIPSFIRKKLDSFFHKKAAALLRKSSAVIATSKDYGDSSSILKDMDYKEIPIGIHMNEYPLPVDGEDGEDFDFLFVGRLAASKGIDVLLRASAELAVRGKSFKVKIIGSGEENKKLIKMAANLSVADIVTFEGKLPQDELIMAFSSARALVLPSVSRLEAFGIVQLEAFCFGKPVIVSDLPGVRGLVRQSGGGWIVSPGDHLELADAMEEVINEKSEAEDRGAKGFGFISEHNSWDKIAAGIEDIYLRELMEYNTLEPEDVSRR